MLRESAQECHPRGTAREHRRAIASDGRRIDKELAREGRRIKIDPQ